MKIFSLITIIFVLLVFNVLDIKAQSTTENELIVRVTNIKKAEGQIRVAAYRPDQKFLGEDIAMGVIAEVNEVGEVLATFKDLSFGTYGLSLYHDVNGNGELDTNFMGIPKEPYGFSNNARGTFGPPKYTAAQFEYTKSGQQVTIKIK